MMLTKTHTAKLGFLRYAALVPLVATLFALFSLSLTPQTLAAPNTNNKVVIPQNLHAGSVTVFKGIVTKEDGITPTSAVIIIQNADTKEIIAKYKNNPRTGKYLAVVTGDNEFAFSVNNELGIKYSKIESTATEVPSESNNAFRTIEKNFRLFEMKNTDGPEVIDMQQMKSVDESDPSFIIQELNEESTTKITGFLCNNVGDVEWETSNENQKFPFQIEQYRWGKWIAVANVESKGSGDNKYATKIILHTGENQIRIRQYDGNKVVTEKKTTSLTLATDVPEAPVSFAPKKVSNEIDFSAHTLFEIYDKFGKLVKKGYGSTIDVSSLESDVYYLNYDNTTGDQFIKK